MSSQPTKRGTTSRSVFENGWLVGLLTHHPIAKLFSIAAATLLMVLIDRELTELIYDQNVALVSQASAGDQGVIIVKADEQYMVLLGEGATKSGILQVEGKKKQREDLLAQEPFEAYLPAERLESLFGSADSGAGREPRRVTVEAGDLRLGPFVTVVELGSMQVTVAKRGRKKVLLTWKNRNSELEVTFSPREVEVVGPSPYVERLTDVAIDVGEAGLSEAVVRAGIADWFRANENEQVRRWAESFSVVGKVPVARAERKAEKNKDIRLTVEIQAMRRQGSRYDIQIGGAATGGRVELTFSGPVSVVEKLEKDAALRAKIETELSVGARVETKIVESQLIAARDKNKDDPDSWWVTYPADLLYDEAVLSRERLRATQQKYDFKARLKQ